MALYDYEKQLSDLQNQYSNDEATNAYAQFISQQRFNRQRQDMAQSYQRQFPQFMGQFARRGVNQGIRSGNMLTQLGNFVGDYNQSQDRLSEDQAQGTANYDQAQAAHQAQYQQALLALQEELQRQRAMANPFAPYQGVFQ